MATPNDEYNRARGLPTSDNPGATITYAPGYGTAGLPPAKDPNAPLDAPSQAVVDAAGALASQAGKSTSNIRAVLTGSGDDASAALARGNYTDAIGHVIRGAAALPMAGAVDFTNNLTAPFTAAQGAGSSLGSGIVRTLYTAATGDSGANLPSFSGGPITAAASSAPKPAAAGDNFVGPRPFPSYSTSGIIANAAAQGAPAAAPANPTTSVAGDFPVRLADGSIVPRAVYDAQRAQAAAQPVDPIERQKQLFEYIRGIAANGDPRSETTRIAMLANALGVSGAGGTQNQVNQQQQNAPLVAAQAAHAGAQAIGTSAQTTGVIQGLNLQQQYLQAAREGRTEDAAKLADQLAVVGGRAAQQDKFLTVPGGQDTNEFGQPITRPSSVFDTRTRSFISNAPTSAPKFEVGKVYQDASGNKGKWDGTKMVAVK